MAPRVISSLLVAIAASGSTMAQTQNPGGFYPDIFFNFTTSVVDAVNMFNPANRPDPTGNSSPSNSSLAVNEWVTTFDESPPFEPGMAGVGASHRTGKVSPVEGIVSMTSSLPWSAVYVYGSGAEPIWEVDGIGKYQDRGAVPPGMLGKETSTIWGAHKLDLSWDQGNNATVDSIVYTMGMKTQAPSFDKVITRVEYAVFPNGTANPMFVNYGPWGGDGPPQINSTIGGAGSQAPIEYPHFVDYLAKIYIPHNTSFVVVNGTVGPNFGIDVTAPFPVDSWTGTRSIDNYNPWEAPSTLFVGTLDPFVKYNLSVGGNIHSATFYSYIYDGPLDDNNSTTNPTASSPDSASETSSASALPSPSPPADSSRPKVAPIIGGVIGGLGAILLVGALIFLYFRHARQRARLEDRGTFIVDVDGSEKLSPYVLKGGDSLLGTRESQVGDLPPALKTQHSSQSLSPLWASMAASGSSPATPDFKYTTGRSPVDDIVVQHEDGGHVNVEHVPPCYNPEWVSPTADPDSVLASGPVRPPGISDKEYMDYIYNDELAPWPHASPSAGPSAGPSTGVSSGPSAGLSSASSPAPGWHTPVQSAWTPTGSSGGRSGGYTPWPTARPSGEQPRANSPWAAETSHGFSPASPPAPSGLSASPSGGYHDWSSEPAAGASSGHEAFAAAKSTTSASSRHQDSPNAGTSAGPSIREPSTSLSRGHATRRPTRPSAGSRAPRE